VGSTVGHVTTAAQEVSKCGTKSSDPTCKPSCATPGSAWSAQAVSAAPSVQHTAGWSVTSIDGIMLQRQKAGACWGSLCVMAC